ARLPDPVPLRRLRDDPHVRLHPGGARGVDPVDGAAGGLRASRDVRSEPVVTASAGRALGVAAPGERRYAVLLGSVGLAVLALVGWQLSWLLVFVVPELLATLPTLVTTAG